MAGGAGPSRRSSGSRSRSERTRRPRPASSSSQPSRPPMVQRRDHRARTRREPLRSGSNALPSASSRSKSPGPPGVGKAQTSSTRKSGAISWIRQGWLVCAVFGSCIEVLRPVGSIVLHTFMSVGMTQHERRARSRSALLEAAARGLSRHGYANLVLEDVARDAGYTRGALYHQFRDKEDLVRAALAWVDESWRAEVGALVEREPEPVAALLALARGHAVFCRREIARVAMA